MNFERTLTAALVAAALGISAIPSDAQERATRRQQRGDRAASAPAPRQDRAQRAAPRSAPQARQNAPRGSQRQQYSGPARAPRAYDGRSSRAQPRAVPRPSYRYDAGPRYIPPRATVRPYYSRPYLYSRPYVRPYNYVPYRPFYFSRPYYSFRPRFSIGFGLWIGNTVPYPYAYLGAYRPRVYGYYAPGPYDVRPAVPIYGGVSFDIQPSDADLFVDGEYVGPVGNFTPYTEPLTLTPGVHRISIQRDGFRAMEWDVTIQPGQVIPYRGGMER